MEKYDRCIYDRKIPNKVKSKSKVKPAMLYGSGWCLRYNPQDECEHEQDYE